MRKILLTLTVLFLPICSAYAQKYTSVYEIEKGIPEVIETMGTLKGIICPTSPIVAEFDVENDATAEQMKAYRADLANLKYAFIAYLYTKGEILNSLAHIAYNANVPFCIHIYANCDPKGFTIELSPKDLEVSFTRDLKLIEKYIEENYLSKNK